LRIAARYAPLTQSLILSTGTTSSDIAFPSSGNQPIPSVTKGGDFKRDEAKKAEDEAKAAAYKANSLRKEADDLDFIADVMKACGL
jgi:hypothetical protein